MTLASLCSHLPSLLSPKGSPQMIINSTIRCVSWNSNHWELRTLREKLFGEMQIQFTTWGWSWGRKLPGITWRHHDAQSRSFWAGPQVLLLQSSLLRAVYGMATKKQDSVPLWTSCEWRLPPFSHNTACSHSCLGSQQIWGWERKWCLTADHRVDRWLMHKLLLYPVLPPVVSMLVTGKRNLLHSGRRFAQEQNILERVIV